MSRTRCFEPLVFAVRSAFLLCGLCHAVRAAAFCNTAEKVGLVYNQFATLGTNQVEPFLMTGGGAVVDYNRDGWPDLFVTRMDAPPILFVNQQGRFEALPGERIGVSLASGANGVAWADVDNDGDGDLHITTVGHGRNYLYLNEGDRFLEVAVERGVDSSTGFPPRSGYGSAFGDYDRDGYLDLFSSSWGDYGGVANRLFRNQGQSRPGWFMDVTERAGVSMADMLAEDIAPRYAYGFAPRFVDFDNDRWPDLAVVADYRNSRLFWNRADGTFADGTRTAGVGTEDNGMGSTVGDFNGDGRLDWFVTSIFNADSLFGGTGNRLFENIGNRQFRDVTTAAGVREGGWGWGTAFFDADNDGDLDLMMTNGIRFEEPVYTKFREDRTTVWRNNGDGTFTDMSQAWGVTDTGDGKGLMILDYDRDGRLDVFIVNTAGAPILYRNELPATNQWIQLRLRGVTSNRDAIGACIILQAESASAGSTQQVRLVDGGNNYLGQDERIVHFGLGPASGSNFRAIIRWPSGVVQAVPQLQPGMRHEIVETSDYLRWQSGAFPEPSGTGSSQAAPGADPDGDGLVNQAEYLTGRNPRRPESTPVYRLSIEPGDGSRWLRIELDRDPDALEAEWAIETAPRLDAATPWASIHVPPEPSGPGNASDGRTMVLRIPITEGEEYMRLLVLDTKRIAANASFRGGGLADRP